LSVERSCRVGNKASSSGRIFYGPWERRRNGVPGDVCENLRR
jgi:hypothetical protein